MDETSLRVDKKIIGSTFILRERAINVIPRYLGVIIHDFCSSYLTYDHCVHGMCGALIIRELTAIQGANDYRWAENMKELLRETCKTVSRRKNKRLTLREYARLQRRYRNILT